MSFHVVFRESVRNFMPFSFEYQQPASYFIKNHGAIISYQDEFFDGVCQSLNKEDTVVLFIDIDSEEKAEILASTTARKVLRVVDPSKSDRKLYKNALALHEKVNFDAFAICYPNKDHVDFLKNKGIEVIVWPHTLDFSDSKDSVKKSGIWISSGQQHQECYPSRWKLTDILMRNFGEYGTFLPHPGYELDNLRHPYIGKKYLDLLENYWFMPIGIGINDGLHMKFVEAAYSNSLPIGTVPSYVPDHIAELVPFSKVDPNDYNEQTIIRELVRLVNNPEELARRISLYKQYFIENYNLPNVLENLADKILKR